MVAKPINVFYENVAKLTTNYSFYFSHMLKLKHTINIYMR